MIGFAQRWRGRGIDGAVGHGVDRLVRHGVVGLVGYRVMRLVGYGVAWLVRDRVTGRMRHLAGNLLRAVNVGHADIRRRVRA